jgi:hypothetical protein
MQGSHDPQLELLDAASLCGHLIPTGSVYEFLIEHRSQIFPDDWFADLFPSSRGRPSVPGEVVATVMVLQALEGLSDRDAVRQLGTSILWKAACGLSITAEPFHPTVLTLWRNRLRESRSPQRIFDAVRKIVDDRGLLSGKTRRALDSTVLDDAVTTQDAIMQLVSAIRRVRRLVPEAKTLELTTHRYDTDPGKPACAWDDSEAIDELITNLIRDAQLTLAVCVDLDLDQEQQDAVGLLALVARQDVEEGNSPGTWRIARGTAEDRVISVVDPDARHVHKTVHAYRDGYKGHIAVEPETGIITGCELTAGNQPDGPTGVALITDEDPVEVLADSAYGSGETRSALRDLGHGMSIKPIPLRAAVEGGFTKDDFLPRTTDRPHQQQEQRLVREPLSRLPAPSSLHDVTSRTQDRRPPS